MGNAVEARLYAGFCDIAGLALLHLPRQLFERAVAIPVWAEPVHRVPELWLKYRHQGFAEGGLRQLVLVRGYAYRAQLAVRFRYEHPQRGLRLVAFLLKPLRQPFQAPFQVCPILVFGGVVHACRLPAVHFQAAFAQQLPVDQVA